MIFFFFSSRRRHTRCLSDWSSDVCSSDLSRKNGCRRREDEEARSRTTQGWPSVAQRLKNARTGKDQSHRDEVPGNDAQIVGAESHYLRLTREEADERFR